MHEHVSSIYIKFSDFKKELFEFFDATLSRIAHLLIDTIIDNFCVAGGA